ncbi:hypothetical protein [Bifidobacterium sp. ESL0790]|uniref:hypothetical protein n=1 Tax=Bifidobacterium sp. ESL0790 TaxID=2983233 RepID=UPI0023F7F4FD|nr:hypothetical protein [Bifidobacterium sp. ESL0790]WEV72512.1 hypothetical protein OZY47_00535 [Bifidobacterium sp. ESL0790]
MGADFDVDAGVGFDVDVDFCFDAGAGGGVGADGDSGAMAEAPTSLACATWPDVIPTQHRAMTDTAAAIVFTFTVAIAFNIDSHPRTGTSCSIGSSARTFPPTIYQSIRPIPFNLKYSIYMTVFRLYAASTIPLDSRQRNG